ncbi:MAG: ribosome-binding factor A [Acidimicrobiia bacterium]|nr:MAG: ribosome-binding factor A [Acidimicrobiia bacterium]
MTRQKNSRMRKVNELVREVIAEAVLDLKDPRIGFLTITGAETSPDLRHAVIFYSVLGSEEEKQETAEALRRSASRLQAVIGSETRLRYTPVLEFRVDPAIDEGIRISQILSDMSENEEEEVEVGDQEVEVADREIESA